MTSGMDRNRLTYSAAKFERNQFLDNRRRAIRVPSTMPTTMATPVISSVRTIPCHKNGSAPGIELQSNSYIVVVTRNGAMRGVQELQDSGVTGDKAPPPCFNVFHVKSNATSREST